MTSDTPVITEKVPQTGKIAEAQANYEATRAARRAAYIAYRDADRRLWDARQRPTPRPAGAAASALVAAR